MAVFYKDWQEEIKVEHTGIRRNAIVAICAGATAGLITFFNVRALEEGAPYISVFAGAIIFLVSLELSAEDKKLL